MAEKCLCQVGGYQFMEVPGTEYTFGTGANCNGPISLSAVGPDDITEGYAVATPVSNYLDGWDPVCCREGGGIGWFNGDHPQCCGNCRA